MTSLQHYRIMTEQEFQRFEAANDIRQKIKQCETNKKLVSEAQQGRGLSILVSNGRDLPSDTMKMDEETRTGVLEALDGYFNYRIDDLKKQFEAL